MNRSETNQEKELAALYEAGLAVTATLDLSQVLHSAAERASKLIGADVVTLYLYDQARGDFVPPPVAVGVSDGFWTRGLPSRDGSAAQIAKTGEPIIADDAKDHPKISRGFIKAESIASSAGFPLKVAERVVGVLFLNYHAPHKFTTEDIEKVTVFASQAAIAIRNADLFKQQDATTKRLEVILKAKAAIDSAAGLQDVLDQILSEGLKIVDTTRGSLMLFEGEEYLRIRAQFGPEVGHPDWESIGGFKIGEGIAGQVAKTGKAILCSDVLNDKRFKHPRRELSFRSLLAVPIISHRGKVIGVISADDPEIGHFEETDKQLLSDMAGQFATAIERMMLVNTLHALHKIFESITTVAVSSGSVRPVLDEIARSAVEVLGIDVITIYQYDQAQDKFIVPPLMKGISKEPPMQTEVFEGEAPWVLIHELKGHYYAPDSLKDPIMSPSRPLGKGPGFVEREGIKSSAGLRLKAGEELVGVMFVNYRSPHQFDEGEKQIIETFANSAAIAIQDARQWENLQRTQEQLVQSAKMSAVGDLASGIAHELKNPLSNILSSVNVLEMMLRDISNPQADQRVKQIKGEVHRAKSIIDSLLDFVRPPKVMRGPVDVLALVNETLNLLGNQARLNHVNIETRFTPSPLPLIGGNASLLRQVFFNIVKNAIEAMPEGGRLKVTTSTDNENIQVKVQDTGPGIPLDIQSRIFDPFFSTGEPGQGTGLGLTISMGIVRDHHGDIKVESKLGKGSTFTVILPIGE
jgi:signal transduction histidine kinase